jgi:hypothetical protein
MLQETLGHSVCGENSDMKNKSVKNILIGLTIVIWGTIAYKLSDYFSDDEVEPVAEIETQMVSEKSNVSDTFKIMANYRDPFLGKSNFNYNPEQSNNSSAKTIIKKPEQPPVIIKALSWPNMNYQGLIMNQKSKIKTGILKINGRDNLIKQGDIISDIEIVALSSDSVLVKLNNEVKSIVKSK